MVYITYAHDCAGVAWTCHAHLHEACEKMSGSDIGVSREVGKGLLGSMWQGAGGVVDTCVI